MPRRINAKKTNRYSQEFKVKAVQLSQLKSVQVQEIAQALDIHPFMLSRWRKEYREGKIVADNRKKVMKLPSKMSENDRIRVLEKENARLKTENELLKKWQRFLAERKQKGLRS